MKTLLGVSRDAKTTKGQKLGYLTGILYLAPSNESEVLNTCPFASRGCRLACLFTAGRGAFSNVRNARIEKTIWFVRDRTGFMAQLVSDIHALLRKARKAKLRPCVRLNGTSDIPWEHISVDGFENLMEMFPAVQFYDYTKNPNRAVAFASGKLPKNYQLTLSRSEANQSHVETAVARKVNVAVVFSGSLPKRFLGRPVINGDLSDVRFADPKGVIVGLKAKGRAKRDQSGFVVPSLN